MQSARILACASWLLLAVGCSQPGLATVPEAKPLVYVAIGASDAVGIGAADPARDGWVPVLHRLLPPDTRLVNLGISGTVLHDALRQQLPVALDAAPDLVTIWLAVNDFNARIPLEEYSADLDEMLGQLEANTQARVLIGNIPDLTAIPLYANVPRDALHAEVTRWNAAIAAAAERHGATLVDFYELGPELARRPELVGADGFHPSVEGHRRIAEILWEAIEANQMLP